MAATLDEQQTVVDRSNKRDDLCHLAATEAKVWSFCGKRISGPVCLTPVSDEERTCPQCGRDLCIVCLDLRWIGIVTRRGIYDQRND